MARLGRTAIILTSLLIFTGCGEEKPESEKAVRAPIAVMTTAVKPADAIETIQAAGTVRFRRETPLGFTTNGQVATVNFEAGDQVRRGALLAALDTSLVASDLAAADAQREQADSELARIEQLYRQGWVTKARLEQTAASAKASRANVESRRFASRTSRITAPSNGIILARNIDKGQVIAAGSTALTIGETEAGFILRVPMSDRDAARVRVGQTAMVTIKAVSDSPLAAVISEKNGRADERTGTFEVNFRLPPNERLRSGQLGSAAITVSSNAAAGLAIPATALFGLRADEGLVWVVDDKNFVNSRNVMVGRLNDKYLEIHSGLAPGEIIVIRGVEKLHKGDRIQPVGKAQ